MESAHCVASGSLLKFSEQQLVDCVTFCFGCHGGNTDMAFHYYQNYYAMSEASYGYKALNQTCKYDANNTTGVFCQTWHQVTPDSPNLMKDNLMNQPLSVAIQANQIAFQTYTSGIFSDTSCGVNLDHAV